MAYQITTQKELRVAFWETKPYGHLQLRKSSRNQNDYPTDTRVAWVDFVDAMARDGTISEKLAERATL
jgi:hypothetical protein